MLNNVDHSQIFIQQNKEQQISKARLALFPFEPLSALNSQLSTGWVPNSTPNPTFAELLDRIWC